MVARVGGAAVYKTAANVMVEIALEAKDEHKDPFNELTLDAIFTDPAGKSVRVPGFWAGGRAWKIRYASPKVGSHRFKAESSDAGLNGVEGVVEVEAYKGQ